MRSLVLYALTCKPVNDFRPFLVLTRKSALNLLELASKKMQRLAYSTYDILYRRVFTISSHTYV
jgi:hypothetical protein